ncbi:energy-coupling factor transport system ATP-binding protein [Propionibacterium cyclohexanicum]|uniref:Energy-coupling factor transport system ATP-binding protein n=1 Tax=Propionibacterium cyclohexanicum TaxID=64702 RepID=A0A1H9RU52_9ACTN|nr:ABC transporter ATP-binding protein [Propionibacterium cyclohexanicum]SER76332.1 energy-coupling factor transport system ATP-binding protein [Propionibacterium cyclohexanicum]
MTEAAAVLAQDWGWRYAGRTRWATRRISFSIGTGERVLLLGGSGAGKSTLLSAVNGILGGADEGEEEGQLLVDGRHPSRLHGRVGLVMQDPSSQVILERIGDDVAFGCENLGVPREQIWPRVRAALDAVRLDLPLDHPTSALSGGQQQRLAIAGALAMQDGEDRAPGVLCLDEPTANLDPTGVREVREVISSVVADRRTTLIVVEHRVRIWAELVDRVIVLASGGGLLADGTPSEVFAAHHDELVRAGAWVPGAHSDLRRRRVPSTPPPAILSARDLAIGREPAHLVTSGVRTQIPEGLSTAITGPNGVGKTTLALTLAGLLEPLAGQVEAAASLRPARPARLARNLRRRFDPARPNTWPSRELLTRIGSVFQNPEHQFVEARVRDELAVGLRALGRSHDECARRVDELLAQLHLEQVADANPFTLSGGEKRRLSVGTVLATGPAVIFLDEPTFGQDHNTWTDLVSLITRILEQGCTIVSVTHDEAYLRLLGENIVAMEPAA